MYAIIETGGKQYKVQPGQVVEVELLDVESGPVTFDRVLLFSDKGSVTIGSPTVPNAKVTGQVLGLVKTKKIVSVKYRRRKDSRWAKGHRQNLARVQVDEIAVS